jgi:hypothetical protein
VKRGTDPDLSDVVNLVVPLSPVGGAGMDRRTGAAGSAPVDVVDRSRRQQANARARAPGLRARMLLVGAENATGIQACIPVRGGGLRGAAGSLRPPRAPWVGRPVWTVSE